MEIFLSRTYRYGPWLVLTLMVVVSGAGFAWLAVMRHLAYQSHAFDLGNMDQAVWSTLHGHPLRFTDMQVGRQVLGSRLAIHVEPILVALAPLYALHSGPETLLVVQALVVATGAVPAFLLALRHVGDPWLSLVFPAAFLLHPSLQNALLDDFHAVTLSCALLLWVIYALDAERWLLFTVFALLSMATKEEVSLIVASLGIFVLARRHRVTGLVVAIAGAVWFYLCVAAIIPHVNPSGQSPYLARYSYLGRGLRGVLVGGVLHPHRVVSVLLSPSRAHYLQYLLQPLGWSPLFGFSFMLVAVPVLLINMLSTDPTMYSGFYQYSAEVVPLLMAAGIIGVGHVVNAARFAHHNAFTGVRLTLCLLVLGAAVVDARRYGYSPLAAGFVVPSAGAHQQLENRMVSAIPANAVVASADEIEPHVSQRRWSYLLPTVHPVNGPPAGYIILDASVPSLPVSPRMLARVVRGLLGTYGIVAANEGILLLQRGAGVRKLPPEFYTYVFRAPSAATPCRAGWGPLELRGFVIHPRSRTTNRARPAIDIETVWRASSPVNVHTHIQFWISPVYTGPHPKFSSAWRRESDSPTWAWIAPHKWPLHRSIVAASLPLIPPAGSRGSVDVGVQVVGSGAALTLRGVHAIGGSTTVVRLGTLSVSP